MNTPSILVHRVIVNDAKYNFTPDEIYDLMKRQKGEYFIGYMDKANAEEAADIIRAKGHSVTVKPSRIMPA